MTIEEGEIEDGEVPEEEGELRDTTDDEEHGSDKRKAPSPTTGQESKRAKIEDPEEGELSEDGEINSPEPMDLNNSKDLSDGELEKCFSKVDFFPEKPKTHIDWESVLPRTSPLVEPPPPLTFDPLSIFKRTQLRRHMATLIRDPDLKAKIEKVFTTDDNGEQMTTDPPPTRSSLPTILQQNRAKLGMPDQVPIRPFVTPNRIRGELSNRVTHFVHIFDPVQICPHHDHDLKFVTLALLCVTYLFGEARAVSNAKKTQALAWPREKYRRKREGTAGARQWLRCRVTTLSPS